MAYLVNGYVGRLRMLNWKSGDTGPRITRPASKLFQSLVMLKKIEDAKHGR